MVITDIFIHLANVSYLIGSSFKRIIYLRVFLVIGCIFEILYFLFISPQNLWAVILWAILIMLLNIVMIGLFIYEKGTFNLTGDENYLFNTVFSQMEKLNFKKLFAAGNWLNMESEDILIFENHTTESLMLISQGIVGIYVGDNQVAVLHSGSFVGEMSFLSGGVATATAKALTKVKLFIWKKPALIKLLSRNEGLDADMRKIFASDLVSKLTSTNIVDK
jgi:hypothetical protein